MMRSRKCYKNRANILRPVKEYIDTFLDAIKAEGYKLHLRRNGITRNDYYEALKISTDNDFQIHFRREPSSYFVNNYFNEGLLAWKANIDIQPVINHYKAVAYVYLFF